MRNIIDPGFWKRLSRPVGKGRRRLLALDINNLRITLALASASRSGPVLERVHVERLEEYDNEGTPGLDSGQREAIARLVEEYELVGLETVASLPYKSYSIRLVVLPRMPRREVRNALRLDLKSNTKFNENTELFDFVTVDSFSQDEMTYDNHLVATINRARLDEHVGFLAGLGLRVHGFSVPALAIRNLLAHDTDVESDGVYAVVHMSHEETSFSLVHHDRLLFTREIPRTARELTEALLNIVTSDGKTLHLDPHRASELKFEYGVIGDDMMGEVTDDGIPLEQVAVMMRPVLEKMLAEIRRSIDFCREQFGVEAPRRLFLSGGDAQLQNLSEYLSSRLRIETGFVDATRGYTCGPDVVKEVLNIRRHVLSSAIGAALYVDRDGAIFAPPEYVAADHRRVRIALRAATSVAALFAVGGVLLSQGTSARVRGRLAEKNQTLARLERVRDRYAGEADQVKLRRFRHDTLISLVGNGAPWGEVMRDLSRRVPVDVQLTEMSGERVPVGDTAFERRLRFTGLISLRHDRVESVVSRLLDGLSGSPYFDDVRLESVSAGDEEVANVRFSCRLNV